ncbi:hypothetical protein Pcinc_030191 [Petrolisthes cinctipes]|uniref:Uncharacterized protein n=1 Tax=Petrolisthes cinctipes TaxID=88211 RepID=A0AAE1EYL1_PETCI|nr:hypothetical protein Pcinc_030191 [Petrolisthes cinctipes]
MTAGTTQRHTTPTTTTTTITINNTTTTTITINNTTTTTNPIPTVTPNTTMTNPTTTLELGQNDRRNTQIFNLDHRAGKFSHQDKLVESLLTNSDIIGTVEMRNQHHHHHNSKLQHSTKHRHNPLVLEE